MTAGQFHPVGKGGLVWLRERPASCSVSAAGAAKIIETAKEAVSHAGLKWRETNYLLLRRGPYVIAAGLDESIDGNPKQLRGRFVNLFDPELRVLSEITLEPGSRRLLLDLDAMKTSKSHLLVSACKALPREEAFARLSYSVEGVDHTPAIVLVKSLKPPRRVVLGAGTPWLPRKQPRTRGHRGATSRDSGCRGARPTSPGTKQGGGVVHSSIRNSVSHFYCHRAWRPARS